MRFSNGASRWINVVLLTFVPNFEHSIYAQSAPATPDMTASILTPPPPAAPRINGPSVFGMRPGHPILFHVPATGDRPITYSADGLPEGTKLDAATGQLSGSIANEGTYKITLHASNAKGTHSRNFQLVVGDTIALTPPMGWNSYNIWSDQITQDRAPRRSQGDGLVRADRSRR